MPRAFRYHAHREALLRSVAWPLGAGVRARAEGPARRDVPSRVLAMAQTLATGASRERGVRRELLDHLRSRPNALWTLPRLATLTGRPPAQIDAELAAVLLDQARGPLGKLATGLGR